MRLINKFIIVILILFCISCKQNKINKLVINKNEININNINGDININDSYLVITEGGEYVLKGFINNGSVIIRTQDDVKLILDGINIKSDSNGAIVSQEKCNLTIESKVNSNNYIEDSTKRDDDTSKYNATIYSKGKLVLQGDGNLEIKGNYNDSINCIKNITIKNGNYKIISKQDGIQANDDIIIENGYFDIKTIGYDNVNISNYLFGGYDKDDDGSKKGIKTDGDIYINDGEFVFNTMDDSIHCSGDINIINSKMNISSFDDGIHADNKITIKNGDYTISQSYEGIEALDIVIENGIYRINAIDDGINANSKYKEESLENIRYSELIIYDGNFYVDAYGDCVDSNGNITIENGNFVFNCELEILDYDFKINILNANIIGFSSDYYSKPNNFNTSTNTLIFNFDEDLDVDSKINIIGNDVNLNYSNKITSSSILIINRELREDNNYYLEVNGKKIFDFNMKQKLLFR